MNFLKDNKYYFFCLLIFFSLSLISCNQDSLGIEGNIRITPLDTNNKPDTTHNEKPKKYKATAIIPHFYEMVILENDSVARSVLYYIPNAILSDFQIDTTHNPPYIWINLNLENPFTDLDYQNFGRLQYIKSLRTKVDSIEADGYYSISGSYPNGNWAETIMNDIENNRKYIFSGSDANLSLDFYTIEKGHIEVKINTKVPYNTTNKDMLFLIGSIDIYYQIE